MIDRCEICLVPPTFVAVGAKASMLVCDDCKRTIETAMRMNVHQSRMFVAYVGDEAARYVQTDTDEEPFSILDWRRFHDEITLDAADDLFRAGLADGTIVRVTEKVVAMPKITFDVATGNGFCENCGSIPGNVHYLNCTMARISP